ncbi:hypothetical protein BOTBODRAFT_148496 [Botryobasidium botryosum FD-172 SS1]|uniref:Uncharacterized protein n=1 Tax=Botryobasidium botryosum (strain FD-172 SS1) TaxID=930990 RepID=A0A067M051_BOTB1|nr:hypothetical protein BOTBODRAFT_148496 [Botryobasidium botryosum FD-172 SS1]
MLYPRFQVVACPTNEQALTNLLIVNAQDFSDGQSVLLAESFPVMTTHDTTGTISPGAVGCSSALREWMGLQLYPGLSIALTPLCPSDIPRLHTISISLHHWNIKRLPVTNNSDPECDERLSTYDEGFDQAALRSHVMSLLHGHLLTPNRILVFDFHLKLIRVVIESVAFPMFPDSCDTIDIYSDMGVMTGSTKIHFVEPDGEHRKQGWIPLRLHQNETHEIGELSDDESEQTESDAGSENFSDVDWVVIAEHDTW